MDDLVLRSAYLRLSDDILLRKLAHDLSVTKSDLIRAAIHVKLEDWRSANDPDAVLRDLAFRVGDAKVSRSVRVTVPKQPRGRTAPKPESKGAVKASSLRAAKKAPTKADALIPA